MLAGKLEEDVDFDMDTCFRAQVSDAPTAIAVDEFSELVEFDDDDDEDEESAGMPEESPEPPPRSWNITPCHVDLQADTIKAFRELAKLKVDGFASLDSNYVPPRRAWKIETEDLANEPEVLAAVQNYFGLLQSNEEADCDDEGDDVDGFESLDSDYVPPRRAWKIESNDLANEPEVLAAVQNYFGRLQSSEEAGYGDEDEH